MSPSSLKRPRSPSPSPTSSSSSTSCIHYAPLPITTMTPIGWGPFQVLNKLPDLLSYTEAPYQRQSTLPPDPTAPFVHWSGDIQFRWSLPTTSSFTQAIQLNSSTNSSAPEVRPTASFRPTTITTTQDTWIFAMHVAQNGIYFTYPSSFSFSSSESESIPSSAQSGSKDSTQEEEEQHNHALTTTTTPLSPTHPSSLSLTYLKLSYLNLGLHAMVQGPPTLVYAQCPLKKSMVYQSNALLELDDTNEKDEDEEEMIEVWWQPVDEHQAESLYQALSLCASLHPDLDSMDQEQGLGDDEDQDEDPDSSYDLEQDRWFTAEDFMDLPKEISSNSRVPTHTNEVDTPFQLSEQGLAVLHRWEQHRQENTESGEVDMNKAEGKENQEPEKVLEE